MTSCTNASLAIERWRTFGGESGEELPDDKRAEGEKESKILLATADKESLVLRAQGQKEAFDLVNKSFVGPSVTLKTLETTQACFQRNSKIIVPQGSSIVNFLLDSKNTPEDSDSSVSEPVLDALMPMASMIGDSTIPAPRRGRRPLQR